MAKYLVNLTNGQMDEKGIYWPLYDLLTQSGVLQAGALAVSAQDTPDMTVKVAGAATGHSIAFLTSAGDMYYGRNTANENVTITSNASGVTKTDAIVAYADLSAGISTSNNPGALKFVAVRRSGSNTGQPTSGEISSAVSSNPYVVLRFVTVANGASSINSGNLSGEPPRALVEADRLEPIGPNQITDVAVTTAKLNDASVTAAKLGSLTSSGFDVNLVNGAISGLTHSIMVGTTGAGVAQFKATLNISSASIPVTAKVIRYDFWVMAAGNNSQVVRCPVIAYTTANNGSILTSVSFQGLTAANDTGFPNNTNSRLQGSITYIA